MFLVIIVSLSLLFITFDDGILKIKGFLFVVILIVAGYIDIKTKAIPDYIHILIIIVGLLIAVVVNGIYYWIKKKDKTIGFALAPYFAFGGIVVTLWKF